MMLFSTIFGVLTGLIGNGLTAWTNFKTQKLKNEHDVKMYDLELKKIEVSTDSAIKLAKAKIEGEVELADSRAYDESQREGNKKSFSDTWIERLFEVKGWLSWVAVPSAVLLAVLLGFVDFLKGLMRPGLTLYLTAVTSWITWQSYQILQNSDAFITSTQAIHMWTEVTNIVIYLTVSCVTWWFGDRRMAKFLARLKNEDTQNKPLVMHSPSNTDNSDIPSLTKPKK